MNQYGLPENRPPIHPGEMLKTEFLEPMEISQQELADRMGVHYPRINKLVNGKRGITPETALMLAKIFDTTAKSWTQAQADYDLYQALHGDSGDKLDDSQPAI